MLPNILNLRTKLNTQLVGLKQILLKNGYTENFANKCFKRFMDNIHVVKGTTHSSKEASSTSLSIT